MKNFKLVVKSKNPFEIRYLQEFQIRRVLSENNARR